MTGRGAPRYWGLLESGPATAVAASVRQAEERGLTGLLVPQVFAPPWASLGVAAAASSKLQLGTGIALTFTRSPFETAMAALELDQLSGGRFVLGLGASVRDWNEDRFGVPYDRPLSRFRESVGLIKRLVTAGEQEAVGAFNGEFYKLDLRGVRMPRPLRPSIPIWLGALRRPAIELTAEIADGLIGHPAWSVDWLAGEVREGIEAGLERAGKDRSAFRVMAWLRVAISDDMEQATADAKAGLPMYAMLPQYTSYFAAHGFGDEAAGLQQTGSIGSALAGARRGDSRRDGARVCAGWACCGDTGSDCRTRQVGRRLLPHAPDRAQPRGYCRVHARDRRAGGSAPASVGGGIWLKRSEARARHCWRNGLPER